MTTRLHRGDLPDIARYKGASSGAVAIDTETMGLDLARDRLCVVQLSPGDGSADVVQIPPHAKDAPNLKRLLADKSLLKIFHFARFDLGMLYKAFGVMPEPIYCTKIASRLSRTYTDKHGLKDLVREILGQEISKQQQSSDWGAADLTDAQIAYAASDVAHLHALHGSAAADDFHVSFDPEADLPGVAAAAGGAFAATVSDPAELTGTLKEALAAVQGGRSAVVSVHLPLAQPGPGA